MNVQPVHEVLETRALDNRARYQLLTTLVVPRPIAWVSTYSADGSRNLAPFSYFGALSATPMLVGLSVGHRPRGPKDTLNNIRDTGAFCINVVTPRHLEAMNASSGEYLPNVDEFDMAELRRATQTTWRRRSSRTARPCWNAGCSRRSIWRAPATR